MKAHFPALLCLIAAPVWAQTERSPEIRADEIRKHVGYLASDALEGRGTGTKGERLAAKYLAAEFANYGLQPGAADGTFLQAFDVTGRARLQGEARLSITTASGGDLPQWTRSFAQGKDLSPLPRSATMSQEQQPLVFAGYGISDPKLGYDDYAGLDVAGKAVLVLRHEPREKPPNYTRNAHFVTKIALAKKHKAAALLIVTDPKNHPDDNSVLPFGRGSNDAGIFVAHLRKDLVEGLFRLEKRDLLAIQEGIDKALKPASFPMQAKLNVQVQITRQAVRANNVVAKLPGTHPELAKQVVVIGAHYDHLGRGHAGGSLAGGSRGEIHNGADDNASGTSGLLELAHALASKPTKRTFYFVAFSGEERGLLGSAHFVADPPIARESIVGMLNLDMIGRLGTKSLEVGGVGTAPTFRAMVERVAKAESLKIVGNPSGFGPSDHASFYGAKIPVLFFFTGLHEDYHRPSDDPPLVDYEGAAKVARVALGCALEIGNADQAPSYVAVARRRGRRSNRPRLGVMPGEASQGVGIARVIPGGPAAAGGMQSGDALIRFAAKEIASLTDLRRALAAQKPGDEVSLVVLRSGKPVNLKIKLGQP